MLKSEPEAIRTQIQPSKGNLDYKYLVKKKQREHMVSRVTAISQNVATQQPKPN